MASLAGRSYFSRGWCILESLAACEIQIRALDYEKLRAVLARLPPKLIDIGGESHNEHFEVDAEPVVVEPQRDEAGPAARIAATRLTLERGAGFKPNFEHIDRPLSLSLLDGFIRDVSEGLTAVSNEIDAFVEFTTRRAELVRADGGTRQGRSQQRR